MQYAANINQHEGKGKKYSTNLDRYVVPNLDLKKPDSNWDE
jgi:hypothetical protein